MNHENIGLIINDSNECVEAFRTGNDGAGYRNIIQLIEKIQIFIINLGKSGLNDDKIDDAIAGLNSILVQISEGIINRDGVLISDLIEYELIPIMNRFIKND